MKLRLPVYFMVFGAVVMMPFIASSQKVIDYPPKIVIVCLNGDTRKPLGGVKVVFRKGDTLVKTCITDGTGRCLLLWPKPGNYYIGAAKKTFMEFTLSGVNVPSNQTIVLQIPMESTLPEPEPKSKKKSGHMIASLLSDGNGD